MERITIFERVVAYLEELIPGGDAIDPEIIARKAGCPAPLFQRIFVYITGVNIAEYVRRRRLALAGQALRDGREKVIDIALQFGFQSHAAFTRAFREHHGVTPSQLRDTGCRPVDYPRMSFTNIRIMGGRHIMAELKRIEYTEIGPRKAVGQRKTTTFQTAGKDCWGAAFESGLFPRLEELAPWRCQDLDAYEGFGHMSHFTDKDHFEYVVGACLQADAPVPADLQAADIPAGTVALIQIEADTLEQIIESAFLLCSEAIEKTGYRIDHTHFYWCDIYTRERYAEALAAGRKVAVDYMLPVVREGKS